MAIWNLGSINSDRVYDLPHLPEPGETLAATGVRFGLGGKGANMSVAAARAGATVHHLGAVGRDGGELVHRLSGYGVETRHVVTLDGQTGHAIIAVSPSGENHIIIDPGANRALSAEAIGEALCCAQAGDFFVTQNETSQQLTACRAAAAMGLKVCYAAAPFDAEAVMAVLPHLDLLILNAVEASQLERALGQGVEQLPVADIVVTRGESGCQWISKAEGLVRQFPAYVVQAVDTTGAGDTFTGYLLAGLDRGLPMAAAIDLASMAAALMVSRRGTADVIPELSEVESAMEGALAP
ncbi:MAG: ribokinase [Gammaproteobacteria bacterium]|nr:ribokinase [Gammaproteobacteria bacterium]